MIYGIGTDIVRVARMERILARYGERFARRILTPRELDGFHASRRPAQFLAKRFAAKEAAVKAMGVGFRMGVRPRHIGVTHDPRGRPELECLGRAAELQREFGIGSTHLSLADEHDVALAFVTMMRAGY